jgi:hypothetical protein
MALWHSLALKPSAQCSRLLIFGQGRGTIISRSTALTLVAIGQFFLPAPSLKRSQSELPVLNSKCLLQAGLKSQFLSLSLHRFGLGR